jgi:hypothetical protein
VVFGLPVLMAATLIVVVISHAHCLLDAHHNVHVPSNILWQLPQVNMPSAVELYNLVLKTVMNFQTGQDKVHINIKQG